MHLRCFTTALVLAPLAFPSFAATESELDRLFEAMGIPELITLMGEEGRQQAGDIETDMLGGRGGASWQDAVERIYDEARMAEVFRGDFDAILSEFDIAPLLGFYSTETGEQIVTLELAAREAFLDPAIEAAAEEAVREMRLDDPARADLLAEFVARNNLVDLNVMGGLNSSLAFYEGLTAGGFDMSQAEIMEEVWAQEPFIRDDTDTWIHAYLGLAYDPLTDAELLEYTELTQTEAGRALNRALFEGFDRVFVEISRDLGVTAAGFTLGEDL